MPMIPKRVVVTDGTDELAIDAGGNIGVQVANVVNIADGGTPISVDDNGSTLSIDDGGGVITVDGSVNVGTISNDLTRELGKVVLSDSAGTALSVSSDWGVGYDLLVSAGLDSGGNTGPLRTDANGRLLVTLVDAGTDTERTSFDIVSELSGYGINIGKSGVALADDVGVLIAGKDNVGNAQVLLTDTNGVLGVNVITELPAGTKNIGDVDVLTLPALPTGANTIGSIASIGTSVVPGTGSTNLGKAEDGAHASGHVGVMALAVRRDTPANGANASADGDYVPLLADKSGVLRETRSQYYTKQMTGTETGATQTATSRNWSLQVVKGTATTWTVYVEASNDATNWDIMLTHTDAAPGDKQNIDMTTAGLKIRRFWRIRVNAISNALHTLTVYAVSTED
jgi:hypothetical protein